MDQSRTFDALARRFVNYQELALIPIAENGERMKTRPIMAYAATYLTVP